MDSEAYMAYLEACACPKGAGCTSTTCALGSPRSIWACWMGWIAMLLCVFLSGCSVREPFSEPFSSAAALPLEQPMEESAAVEKTLELTLSAASSLTDVLERLAAMYQEQHPDVRIILNAGASGSLRRQIEEGAPVDLFFSASLSHMEALIRQRLVEEEQCANLLGNRIVMIVPKTVSVPDTTVPTMVPDTDNEEALSYLQAHACAHIALGDPDSVPAGEYATQALTDMELLASITPKLVYGKNVREVLSWVEMGNADAAFVFQTDALQSEKVSIVASLSEKRTGPILYPLAVLRGSRHQEAAADLLAWLGGAEAWTVFEQAGFVRGGGL